MTRLPYPAAHAVVVMVIEMAHTVRMRFGKCRSENGASQCRSRQNLRDAVHGTLPGRSAGYPAGISLTPVNGSRCTALTLN